MTDGLLCESRMPLVWREARPEDDERQAMMREAALLLAAVNQMESSHEMDSGGGETRRLDRLEAKLDLALHLLARTLEPNPPPAGRMVKLGAEGAEWDDETPPGEGRPLVIDLRPSEHLPLTLKLPAVALAPRPGLARARFSDLTESLTDALTQFVFRRHRQAIRARTG